MNNDKPFYGGFGNRPNDGVAYRMVGLSLDKIFIINEKSII